MRFPAYKSNLAPTGTDNLGPARPHFPVWLMAILLVLVTIAIYWPATGGGFVYDDGQYVVNNVHVTSGVTLGNIRWAFGNSYAANWHPVTWLSHMVDCQVFGLNPFGHHLTNVLLHALDTMLVFVFLRSLTGSLWRSFMVAALFGWHPLHVESVAWVAERKDVLSAFFGLLALIFYIRYTRKPETANQEPGTGIHFFRLPLPADYWLSLLFFGLGLMSKPMLVTWPFVLLLLDYWPLARFNSGHLWRLVKEKIPYFTLAAAASVITFLAQRQDAVLSTAEMPVKIRCGNALISYCSYLGKFLWPADLAAFYPFPDQLPIWKVLLAGSIFLCISARLFVRRRQRPFLLVGWLWYCGTLVPVIGLVQVGVQAMADRYVYLPSLGIFILVIWGAVELTHHWRYQAIVLSSAGAVTLILHLALTRQQIGYWRDNVTLFRHALAVTQNNFIARNNLGVALEKKGQENEACGQFREAIRLKPNSGELRYNLAVALDHTGQIDEAISQYREVMRLKPDFAQAYNDLGVALDKKGQDNAARSHYLEAIRLKPNYAEAHYNLGVVLDHKGQVEEAISQYQEAIRLKPDYAEAHNNLGFALEKKGDGAAARSQYQEAIRHKPDYAEAHYNLGNTFFKAIQIDEAAAQYQAAIRQKPDYAEAHNNLGIVLYNKKQIDEAIRQFQEVIRLKPDFAQARNNLALALEEKNAAPNH